MPTLACSTPEAVDPGDTESSTTTAADTDDAVSTSTGATSTGVAQTEGASSSGDVDASSSTSAGEDTGTGTEGPEAVCGNGVVEAGEACDEADEINEDGCNVDCSVSGSRVWSWEPPEGEVIARVDHDPSGQVHALVFVVDQGLSVHRFDDDGVPDMTLPVGAIETPAEAPAGDAGILEFEDLAAAQEAVYVGQYVYWEVDGFILRGQVERLGEDGWVRSFDSGVQYIVARPGGGIAASTEDDVLYAFGADGTEDWVVDAGLNVRRDLIAIPGGIVVPGAERVVAFNDQDGSEMWTFLEPESDMVLSALAGNAEQIWVSGHRFGPTDEDFIFRLDFDGTLLEQIDTTDAGSSKALTPSGNVTWMRRQDIGEPIVIEKLDTSLEPLWAHEFGTVEAWRDLSVGPEGGVAAAKLGELRVLAP